MSTPGTPAAAKPAKAPATNRLSLPMNAYKGAESTLCNGCGHDSITNALIKALSCSRTTSRR
jgi:2-oxoglutarate/2-oxoacid ferredoxin oxidoreductase subunit beta